MLALAWAMAQLGWIAGISVMIAFACISMCTYYFIADCYRFPDPVTGKRNYTYMQAVNSYLGIIIYFLNNSCAQILYLPITCLMIFMLPFDELGGKMHVFCGAVLYAKLAGVTVGYAITSSISMVYVFVLFYHILQLLISISAHNDSAMVVACRAIKKAICFHKHGHDAYCKFSNNPYMVGFGVLQVLLSQTPNFHKLTWLSTMAAATSFGYAFIGSGLSLAVVIQGIITFTYIFPEDFCYISFKILVFIPYISKECH